MSNLIPFRKNGEIRIPQFLLWGIFVAFLFGFISKAAYIIDLKLALEFTGFTSFVGIVLLIQYCVVSFIECTKLLKEITKQKIIEYIKLKKIRIYLTFVPLYQMVEVILNHITKHKQYCVFRC